MPLRRRSGRKYARAQPSQLIQINNPDQVSWVQFPGIVYYAGIGVMVAQRIVVPLISVQF